MKEKFGILMLATAIALLSMASAVFANAAGNETSSGTVEPYPISHPHPVSSPL